MKIHLLFIDPYVVQTCVTFLICGTQNKDVQWKLEKS